jgi:hypothetical protein
MSEQEAVTLRELLESRIDGLAILIERVLAEHKVALDARFASTQADVARTAAYIAERFAQTNEWRGTVTDLIARLVTRDEYESKHADLDNRLHAIEQARANLEGRLWAIGAIVMMVNVGIAVAGFLSRR